MKKLLLSFTMLLTGLNAINAQCTPDPSVTTTGFKVSDTCAVRTLPFDSKITIWVPDTLDVSGTKVPMDSIVITGLKLGTGTGLGVVYNNGDKAIKPKIAYCATISAPTVVGLAGLYSTKASGDFKITFSANIYKDGAIKMGITEALLGFAGLEIKFRIANNAAECDWKLGVSSLSIDGLNKLNITPNPVMTQAKISFNSNEQANYDLKITNLVGTQVYQEPIKVVEGENSYAVNVDQLTKGVYFLSISNGVVSTSKKFIISE